MVFIIPASNQPVQPVLNLSSRRIGLLTSQTGCVMMYFIGGKRLPLTVLIITGALS